MKKRKILIIDLVTRGPKTAMWAKVMNANMTGIMPQVTAVWCKQLGHEVRLVCYTGYEDLAAELTDDLDMVIISAFSQSALLSYAISTLAAKRGIVTSLGGPHARNFPSDARLYFDYVFGFTDRDTLSLALEECTPHRPEGALLNAKEQPRELPGVIERWEYIEETLAKAPAIKIVPMIGSLGCPYTCSFCVDAEVPYQPLSYDQISEDLRFILTKFKRPRVSWHDPNFGVRFKDYMDAIERAVPPGRIDFIAETSLALLGESNLKRYAKNGFKAVLPGIESWYELGGKSKTGRRQGMEKVREVADHINMIQRYIPYIQANFVFGLDSDEGEEPFELTKRFLDLAPSAFPAYSLLSAFGQGAPQNVEYYEAGRVLGFPFHFLNNNHAMNVRPLNYSWAKFYDHVVDLTTYSFDWTRLAKRLVADKGMTPKAMNVLRARSSEGQGRRRYHTNIRRLLSEDRSVRDFFEQESTVLPEFYHQQIRKDLGPYYEYLPKEAILHRQEITLGSTEPPPRLQVAASA